MNRITSAGFTAVELLVTLFIAVAFIATGYQLYSIVIKGGGEARQQAKASNIAYDALRQYSAQATNPCSVFTPSPTPTVPASSGLSNASIQVTPSCPYTTSSIVTKITVTVNYGSPQKGVTHAIYVTTQ